MMRCCGTILFVFIALLSAGCGSSNGPNFPTAKISGSIQLDGNPIEKGAIQFIPDQEGQVAGAEIHQGKYEAFKVPRGKVKVLINAVKETGKMLPGYSTPEPEIVNIIPEEYRSGIDLMVTGDKTDQNFELKSK